MGTPHAGSYLATWAERSAILLGIIKQTSPAIVGVLRTDSEVLARINSVFYTMLRERARTQQTQMRITCFFEEIPFPLIGEVGLLPQVRDMSHGMKSFELYLENKSIVLILH